MPFYEYRCADCRDVFTLLQRRDAARQGHTCPTCQSTDTERVFSTFASAVASKSAAPACSHASSGHCCGGGCGCGGH